MSVDRRQQLRGMAYVMLLRERTNPPVRWERVLRPFEATFPGLCGDCGLPVERGDVASQGRAPGDGILSESSVVHLVCPTWENRYERLFQVDGDLVLGYLMDPSDQNCYICGIPLVPHSVKLANPDPYQVWSPTLNGWLPWLRAAYVCDRHRVHVREATSLESRRAEARGDEAPITARGLPQRQ